MPQMQPTWWLGGMALTLLVFLCFICISYFWWSNKEVKPTVSIGISLESNFYKNLLKNDL